MCNCRHLRELVRTHVILTPGACWGGAELQSVDQIPGIRGIPWIRGNPGMGSFLRVLGMKNNENENPISKLLILLCFLLVVVIDFSFSLCFTMNLDAFLLKSCSKATPAALGGCGGLGLRIEVRPRVSARSHSDSIVGPF